jgi:PAS domain S-box-containing protein
MILPLGDHGVFSSGSTENERITESKLNLAKILAANIQTALDWAERERKIERQRDELQAELEDVFERIDDGFFALDDDWRLTYLNDRAERLLGASGREFRGRVVWQAFPELEASAGDELFRRAAATQQQTTDEAYVVVARRSPTPRRWRSARSRPRRGLTFRSDRASSWSSRTCCCGPNSTTSGTCWRTSSRTPWTTAPRALSLRMSAPRTTIPRAPSLRLRTPSRATRPRPTG